MTTFIFRVLLIIVILNEVKNLYPRFADIRDVSSTLNMTFLEHPFIVLSWCFHWQYI